MIIYTNKQTWRCMLGKRSVNIIDRDGICYWEVGKNRNIVIYRDLIESDIEYLKSIIPFKFYYFDESNLVLLNRVGKVDKSKKRSVEVDIRDISYVGKKYSNIRHAINRANNLGVRIIDNLNIDDLRKMIKNWDNVMGERYFQNHSGKTLWFYENNWHIDCLNIFCYIGNEMVSFGTLSREGASYIAGKALCDKYYGLSEFTDYLLYKRGQKIGIEKVNMGQAEKGLLKYKMKFPGATEIIHYNGIVI